MAGKFFTNRITKEALREEREDMETEPGEEVESWEDEKRVELQVESVVGVTSSSVAFEEKESWEATTGSDLVNEASFCGTTPRQARGQQAGLDPLGHLDVWPLAPGNWLLRSQPESLSFRPARRLLIPTPGPAYHAQTGWLSSGPQSSGPVSVDLGIGS